MELAEKMEEAIDEGMFMLTMTTRGSCGKGRKLNVDSKYMTSNGYSRMIKSLRRWL